MAKEPKVDGNFEIELTIPELSFWQLVWSDYRAAMYLGGEEESVRRAALLFLPRMLINPSLQFALLVRIAHRGPKLVQYPIRWLQVILFSCEIYWFKGPDAIEIGPGVVFPHPYGITIGPGTKIGAGVTIYNFTNIGADRHWMPGAHDHTGEGRTPVLGDRSVVYGYTIIQGPWRIGHDSIIGLRVFTDTHVPPGALLTQKRLRLAGEWPGETHRGYWPGAGEPSARAAP
jgi:serine acetyltransferase